MKISQKYRKNFHLYIRLYCIPANIFHRLILKTLAANTKMSMNIDKNFSRRMWTCILLCQF